MSLCSDRQNQFHKSNPNRGLKKVRLQPPVKGGRPRPPPKGDHPIWGSEKIIRESENGAVSSRIVFCEAITRDASNPVSKASNQRQQENKQERRITNRFGNPCDKLYRDVFQDQLPWDQMNIIQRKNELLTRFHCPGIRSKGKNWITESKERQSDNSVSWRYLHVLVDKTFNNQKVSDIFCKKNDRSN